MRNLIILLILVIGITSCNKDNGGYNEPSYNGIVIKGYIPGANTKSQKLKSNNSLTLADAKNVLVFSKYYYELFDIKDSAFTATAQYGTGVALIFLNENYKYIGHLSPQGLSILPLGNLINGENTTIDLAKLTMVGNSVIPSHDPLGNEIIISANELKCLKATDDYYEAIAKNIDANNNSIPDVIEHKQILIYTMLTVFGGKWGLNQTPATLTDSTHYAVNYMVEFGGGDSLTFNYNDISVTGPVEEPYNDIKLWGYMKAPACGGNRGFISSFCRETQAAQDAPWGSAFLPFKAGTYTLTLDGTKKFSLYYSNINMYYNLFIIVPTLHTDENGKLTSITFEYKLQNGSPMDPASLITNVMIQFCDNQMHQFYVNDRNKLTNQTGFNGITFETPLDISRLYQIDLWYDDLLGNQYDIIWRQ